MQPFRIIIWKLLLLLLPLFLSVKGQDYEDFDSWDSADVQDWLRKKKVASRIIEEIDGLRLDGEGLLTEARNDFRGLDLDENDQRSLLRLLCQYVDKEFCGGNDDTTNNKRSSFSSKRNKERTRKDFDEDSRTNIRRGSPPAESRGKNRNAIENKRSTSSTKKKNRYQDSRESNDKLYSIDKESEEEKDQEESKVLDAMLMDIQEKIRELKEEIKAEKNTKQDYETEQLLRFDEQLRQLNKEKSSSNKNSGKKVRSHQDDSIDEKNGDLNEELENRLFGNDPISNFINIDGEYENPDSVNNEEDDSGDDGNDGGEDDSKNSGDDGNNGDEDDENDLDEATAQKILSFLSKHWNKKTTLPPPLPSRSEDKEKNNTILTECFLIIQGQKTAHVKYDKCIKILHKWTEKLMSTEDSPSQRKSNTVSVSTNTNQQSEITGDGDHTKKSEDDGNSEISEQISVGDDLADIIVDGDTGNQNQEFGDMASQSLNEADSPDAKGQPYSESPQDQDDPYSELLVIYRGSTKINLDTLIERVTFVVKENPQLEETKSYRVNWWRKGQESKKMHQTFDKNGKEPLEISILSEIAYEVDIEALDDQDAIVARSTQKSIQEPTPIDGMGETCTSTRLKVRGYGDNYIQLKNLDVNLVQQGAGQSSGWDVDPNDRMTVFGPLTRHWSSLGDKNIAENIRYMMFNEYKLPRIEVSQICLVAFEGSESQPYVSGTQLLVGGSLLVIVIGLFLLRQRLKTDEGAAMLSSLKNTMGKFGGVLTANTRLGGNSVNNNSNVNEIGKNYNTITYGGSGGKRGHAHGSDSDDEGLRITNGTNETDTIMDTGDDDVGNENRMSHSNNVALPKTAINLTKRGNYDEKKTRKIDFVPTSSQASESNERRTKETARHSNKNTELPKRHSKSSTENVRENTEKSNSGSRKNEKEKAKKQSKQITKRKEKQPSEDNSDENRSLEEEQDEEEEEQENTTIKRNNKIDTSSANANKNDESSVDFEDF